MMIKQEDHFHGSDLETIEQLYGIKKEALTAFGANVNPLGVSERLKAALSKHPDVIGSYPDREYKKLRRAIADYCCASPAHILPGNGSTELISIFIGSRQPKNAVILDPTYSEYEREIKRSGGTCHHFLLRAEEGFSLSADSLEAFLLSVEADLLLLCNPNNPTSVLTERAEMIRLLDFCLSHGVHVIVDETYCEFTLDPQTASCIPLAADYPNLTVLRGVSKFFASPGLRLGYAVTSNGELLAYAKEHQNPWSVNSLADLAGQVMFRDLEYIRLTRELTAKERARVTGMLRGLEGLTVFEPRANFVLARLDTPALDADLLFDEAARRGMMIRSCSDFPGLDKRYFRFCFMKPEDNDRLLACIGELLKK